MCWLHRPIRAVIDDLDGDLAFKLLELTEDASYVARWIVSSEPLSGSEPGEPPCVSTTQWSVVPCGEPVDSWPTGLPHGSADLASKQGLPGSAAPPFRVPRRTWL